jgi:hypothetical protein
MNETQDKILKVFFDEQCDSETAELVEFDDGTPSVRYHELEEKTKLPRYILEHEIRELKYAGIVELGMTINQDYMYSGSGYFLTKKGVELVKKFIQKNEIVPTAN